MEKQVTVADWLAHEISQCDITHVFFLEAILRNTLLALARQGVKPILAHSEAAAAYMADGYSRIARKPGICMAQSVGAANLAAALQDAFLGKGQLLAITGRKPQTHQYRNAYQEIDHQKAFSATTKGSQYAAHGSMIPRVFANAWRSLYDGRMQPVHIDVEGLMGEGVEDEVIGVAHESLLAHIGFDSHAPCRIQVERCAEKIAQADKVVIVCGYEAAYWRIGPEIRQLARLIGAPVATTVGGKGLIGWDDPVNIGIIGSYGMPVTNEIVNKAQLIIAVGCQLSDQNTHGWSIVRQDQEIIQLDRNLSEIGKSYIYSMPLVGDLGLSINGLLEAIEARSKRREQGFLDDASARMREWKTAVEAIMESNRNPIRVERVMSEVSKALPTDGILVADTGYSSIWSSVYAALNGDGQEYIRAAGSLGWAFPAAIGAKCAAGGRKVICFTGDGGFYYHISEIETALRNDIPLVVVVNNNSGFGQDSVNMQAKGIERESVRLLAGFNNLSFAAIAKGFGAHAVRVTRPDDIGPAITEALDSNTLSVVEVVTSIDEAAPEAWKPH